MSERLRAWDELLAQADASPDHIYFPGDHNRVVAVHPEEGPYYGHLLILRYPISIPARRLELLLEIFDETIEDGHPVPAHSVKISKAIESSDGQVAIAIWAVNVDGNLSMGTSVMPLISDIRKLVFEFASILDKDLIRRHQAPDPYQRFRELIQSFPCLWAAPGIAPEENPTAFDAAAFDEWSANEFRDYDAQYAAAFILTVWSGGATNSSFKNGRFNAVQAWYAWDDAERRAYRAWLDSPFTM